MPGPFGDDLHGLALTGALRSGQLLFQSSASADVNLGWLDARRAILAVRDAAGSATTATIVWGDLPQDWRAASSAHPGDLEVLPSDDDGNPVGAPVPVAYTSTGEPILAGLQVDRSYLVRLTSQCLIDTECGSPVSPVCCTGRCVAAPDVTSVVRAGSDVVLGWAVTCPAGHTVLRSLSPSNFTGATESAATGGSFRDVGACATPQNYFYLVR